MENEDVVQSEFIWEELKNLSYTIPRILAEGWSTEGELYNIS